MSASVTPIAVVGPTATGSPTLALDLGWSCPGGEIVNIDAMQQYRGMDIGTAKLPREERRGIPHHQLDVLDVTELANAARYQQGVRRHRKAARRRSHACIGGSMMYVQGLLDDWRFPATDPAVRLHDFQRCVRRHRCRGAASSSGLADPAAAASILDDRSRRIVRALEVAELTRAVRASAPTIGEPRWGTKILAS